MKFESWLGLDPKLKFRFGFKNWIQHVYIHGLKFVLELTWIGIHEIRLDLGTTNGS